jgi:hypothetical protein
MVVVRGRGRGLRGKGLWDLGQRGMGRLGPRGSASITPAQT